MDADQYALSPVVMNMNGDEAFRDSPGWFHADYGCVVYPDETLMCRVCRLVFVDAGERMIWKRSSHQTPALLLDFKSTYEIRPAAQRPLSCQQRYLGHILCCINYFPIHNLPDVKAGYYYSTLRIQRRLSGLPVDSILKLNQLNQSWIFEADSEI